MVVSVLSILGPLLLLQRVDTLLDTVLFGNNSGIKVVVLFNCVVHQHDSFVVLADLANRGHVSCREERSAVGCASARKESRTNRGVL